ncbi:unnamed protein product [Ixodes pacificus]
MAQNQKKSHPSCVVIAGRSRRSQSRTEQKRPPPVQANLPWTELRLRFTGM